MCWTDRHLHWLRNTGDHLTTADGVEVTLFEFAHEPDDSILSEWATHFRNHYCLDDEIDELRAGDGLSRRDYLVQIKFPDTEVRPGPSTRSGDFSEILIADYIQYRLGYTVPRTRYCRKTNRNESTQGIDVVGFRMNGDNPSPEDALITFEVKSALSVGTSDHLTLQKAIDDSKKDYRFRKAESLNAMYQKLRDMGQVQERLLIRRFQKGTAHPYIETSGAAAIRSTQNYTEEIIAAAVTTEHPNRDRIMLVVVYGDDLMALVHSLYQKASDEA